MDSRQRFLETMRFGRPDRVPYFEEGIREEVLAAWKAQGLPAGVDLEKLISADCREEIELDVDPHPRPGRWPVSGRELKAFRRRLDPRDPSRLPADWSGRISVWSHRQHVLMLRLHRGFFLSMGVEESGRLFELMKLCKRDPAFVREMMEIQGQFVASLAERLLQKVQIDAAVFSEPIGDNHGSLISPSMYAELVVPGYQPILEALKRFQVEAVVVRTYANARQLIPVWLENGLDCLWACEVNTAAMDYRSLRNEFGPRLRLIGGIDLDVLRRDREAIRREIESKVPPLLEQGGYIPLADGRVREEIPLENYLYYRKILEQVTRQ